MTLAVGGTLNTNTTTKNYSVYVIHLAQYRPTGYPILHIFFLNSPADGMHAKTENSNVLLIRLASRY